MPAESQAVQRARRDPCTEKFHADGRGADVDRTTPKALLTLIRTELPPTLV